MKKFNLFIILLVISVLLISGCSKPETSKTQPTQQPSIEKQAEPKGVSAGGNTAQVIIKGFKFVPNEIRVKVGTTITWKNQDGADHTVESVDASFASDQLANGDTISFIFDKPGKFDYFCGIHPSMKGSVIVE